ncbi:hypothetical protein [Nostoc sp. MG11]|nr:hypothetical protein [Nostoc sp. MG11]
MDAKVGIKVGEFDRGGKTRSIGLSQTKCLSRLNYVSQSITLTVGDHHD